MLQRYVSHKIVEAGKIQGTKFTVVGTLWQIEVGGQQYDVPMDFCARGTPKIGDYLVRYADGYLSWSPAKVFEEGYVLLEDEVKYDCQVGAGGAAPQENPTDGGALVSGAVPTDGSNGLSNESESSDRRVDPPADCAQ